MKTKAKTKAQKRRAKASRPISLAGGVTAAPRATQGMRVHDEPADAMAITARMRQTGMSEGDCRDQKMGCAIGRRLLVDRVQDAADLWNAVVHMRKVVIAYDRAIGAPTRHAQCLRIMAPSETLHADASSPPLDTRTPEDRDRAAVGGWMALQGWLMHADAAARAACISAVVDEPDTPIRDWTGIVLALRCVAEGMSGARVALRERKA